MAEIAFQSDSDLATERSIHIWLRDCLAIIAAASLSGRNRRTVGVRFNSGAIAVFSMQGKGLRVFPTRVR